MSVKVIQWGAGVNGSALIRAIHRHEDLELVGCRVYSDSKNGVDAGVLAGIGPIGVIATNDRNAILATGADIVIHCPHMQPDFTQSDQDIIDLLESGKHVIAVSGAYSYPAAYPGFAERFEAACRAGGTVFTHTGVNPGFICERLAPTLTGLCADVSAVTARETYLCNAGSPEIIFDAMRFGVEVDAWTADSPVGKMFDHLFVQLINNMAYTFGIELERVEHTAHVVAAHRDIEVAGRVVRKGQVAAIGQNWEGVPRDSSQIRLRKETRWIIADDIPGWPVQRGWQIHVEGIPSLDLDVRLAPDGDTTYEADCMVGAAIPVIAEVMKASPGILLPRVYAPFKKRLV